MPDESPIPCEGLLGSEYFKNSHALSNFKYKYLRVGEIFSLFKNRKLIDQRNDYIKKESEFASENEIDNPSVPVKNISHYQPDELDDEISGIWDDKISLGERQHLQFANKAIVEDLDITEKVSVFNMGHLEIFLELNSGKK